MTTLTAPELTRLHAAHADGLFRYFWASTGRVCEAEDLVQEFFVKLARTGAAVRHADCEKAWLFTAARHLAIDWHRRHNRRAEVPADDDDLALLEYHGSTADPDAAFLARELAAALSPSPHPSLSPSTPPRVRRFPVQWSALAAYLRLSAPGAPENPGTSPAAGYSAWPGSFHPDADSETTKLLADLYPARNWNEE